MKVFKLITSPYAKWCHFPQMLRTYPTWMKGRIQTFNNVAFQTLQQLEPKSLRREENGFSTSHVLCMRPYEHLQAKHAKMGLLVKTCNFTPLGT